MALVQQEGFHDGWDKSLEKSHSLPNSMAEKILALAKAEGLADNITVMKKADGETWFDGSGRAIRFQDVRCASRLNQRNVMIEGKMFARFAFFDATGLARRYVNDRLILSAEGGIENTIVVFCDNQEWLQTRLSSKDKKLEGVGGKPLSFWQNDNSTPIAYGAPLRFLMDFARDKYLEEKHIPKRGKIKEPGVRCLFDKYAGELQYLWKIQYFLNADELAQLVFGHLAATEVHATQTMSEITRKYLIWKKRIQP